MLTPKQRKEARRKHRETNKWLESIGRPKNAMPFELMTEKERRNAERKLIKKQRDLEDKRNLDLHIKDAFGIKMPYQWMSNFIRGAGHDKRVRVIEKRALMNYPRIDGNICNGRGRRTKYKFMMFDIDSDLSRDEFYMITGVTPTFFVGKSLTDGKVQRPHAIIEIMFPVPLHCTKHRHELALYERIYDDIYSRLKRAGVDVDYGQKTTFKNPDYDEWHVEISGYGETTLRNLQKELERKAYLDSGYRRAIRRLTGLPEKKQVQVSLPKLPRRTSRHTGNYSGRNDELFHTVRLKIMADWSVLNKRDIFNYSHRLLRELNASRGFNLPASELKSIARSHAKFFKHYRGPKNPNRKVRNEGAAKHLILRYMTTKQKQAVGAYYTHAICTSRSASAVLDFKKKHPEATISSISRSLGMDRKTVRKYFYLTSPSDLAALRKIKELRESAAAFWHATNLTAVVMGDVWPGESGPIRRKHIQIDTVSDPIEPKNEPVEAVRSVRFPSKLVQKLREARLKHPGHGIYSRKVEVDTSPNGSPVDTEPPEIDFLAAFV